MADMQDDAVQKGLLQALTTEHFVLQTARTATVQEANGRASLFLTAVSSATIALAFIGQVTQMGRPFLLFALVVLPCLYFIGLTTFVRTVQLAIEDMVHARGIARIRHGYVEALPDVQRYLIHPIHDDEHAVLTDKALKPSQWQSFMSAAGMVSAIDSVIAGVFVSIAAGMGLRAHIALAIVLGVLAFAASLGLMRRYHTKTWVETERRIPIVFPGSSARPG
jgi:hypothetical protein